MLQLLNNLIGFDKKIILYVDSLTKRTDKNTVMKGTFIRKTRLKMEPCCL